MKSARVVSALRRPLFKTWSTAHAERSFFIWRAPEPGPFQPYQLSTLGILNGFLRHLPKRLVVQGDTVTLQPWPPKETSS